MPLRSMILLALLPLCALSLGLWPGRATADVRRCVTPSGETIFTDRQCADVGAVERLPREQDQASTQARLRRAGGCARTLQDLVFEMTTAIDSRDANRLASVYHWTGQSADAAYRIWNRLDAIANRPLVDIVPVMPASPAEVGDAVQPIAAEATKAPAKEVLTGTPAGASTRNDAADGDLYPQTTVRRNPVALRVEQTLSNGSTPSRTVFGLTRHLGCLWLRF